MYWCICYFIYLSLFMQKQDTLNETLFTSHFDSTCFMYIFNKYQILSLRIFSNLASSIFNGEHPRYSSTLLPTNLKESEFSISHNSIKPELQVSHDRRWPFADLANHTNVMYLTQVQVPVPVAAAVPPALSALCPWIAATRPCLGVRSRPTAAWRDLRPCRASPWVWD